MSLSELLKIIHRRIVLIVVITILTGAAAALFSALQAERYQATASLLFRDPGLDQKLFGSSYLPPSRDPNREAATNVRLVGLDAVAQRAAGSLPGVSDSYLRQNVTVRAEGQSDVVSVSALAATPSAAARIANAFAREFISFRRDADRQKMQEAEQLVRGQLTELSEDERDGAQGRSLEEREQQLQILASLQTGNAELVEMAQPPKQSFSPRPARNAVLGLLVGLLAAIALMVLLQRIDRRIKDPGELEKAFELPLLGVIPKSPRLGPSRPRTIDLSSSELEAFRMLRAHLRYFNVDREIRSVLITSATPGEGKSTVAWNLARAATGAGTRAIVLEADLRRPTIAQTRGLPTSPGLAEVLSGQLVLREVIRGAHESGLPGRSARFDAVVAGTSPPNPVELLESTRMVEVLDELSAEYELVVIDTPPTSVVSDALPLLKLVDGVIVIGRIGMTTRDAALRLRTQLRSVGAPILGVVANGAGGRGGAGYYGVYGTAEATNGATSPAPVVETAT